MFGFISDGLPVFGYRRRPYLIFSGILGSASWIALATLVDTPLSATLVILSTSLSVAISDVIVDSLIVERAREESLSRSGSLQSLSWGASALGGLLTAYFSGLLLQHVSVNQVFEITAVFPLIVSGVAWLIAEERISKDNPETQISPVKGQIEQLWGALKQKQVWLPIAFLFVWQATPTADSAFFFFSTNELGFEPEFLGRVRLVTSFASLVGIFLFQRYLKNRSLSQNIGLEYGNCSSIGHDNLTFSYPH